MPEARVHGRYTDSTDFRALLGAMPGEHRGPSGADGLSESRGWALDVSVRCA
jgi:hypothetical protein